MSVDGFEPDKVIVAMGTNWYNVESYDYEKNAREFYDRVSKVFAGIPVLVITPLWKGDVEDMERFLWCINIIKDACRQYEQFTVVDGFDLVPNVNDCFSDKVHPNAFGSISYTTNLVKVIKDIKF